MTASERPTDADSAGHCKCSRPRALWFEAQIVWPPFAFNMGVGCECRLDQDSLSFCGNILVPYSCIGLGVGKTARTITLNIRVILVASACLPSKCGSLVL